jgi:hypothetical protein
MQLHTILTSLNRDYKDLTQIPECPVFYPTYKEFSDFQKYLEKCEKTLGTEPIYKVCIIIHQLFPMLVILPIVSLTVCGGLKKRAVKF